MSRTTDRPPDPDRSDPDRSDPDRSDPDCSEPGRSGTDPGSRRGPSTGSPRWVRVFGIITLASLVVLVVIGLLTGGHGPGRHTSTDQGGPTPPTVTAPAVPQQ